MVVAILAAITIIGYGWVRDDAMDTSIRSTTSQAVKSLSAHFLRTGTPVAVGFFHVAAPSGSINVDTAMQPYAPTNWRANLKSKNINVSSGIFKFFNCSDDKHVVFASLNNPSTEDMASYSSALTNCPVAASVVSTTGYQYNYAIMF